MKSILPYVRSSPSVDLYIEHYSCVSLAQRPDLNQHTHVGVRSRGDRNRQ